MGDSTNRRVAVVGGGWAGLAAAVEATKGGDRVTLFEMAPTLGGRARSVPVGANAGHIPLDNGQHILIGAYRQTLRLMAEVGADMDAALLRSPLTLVDGTGCGLRLPSGPALQAFARAVLSHGKWTLGERMSLLWTATRWAATGFRCADSLSVSQLCAGIPPNVQRDLIEPLCVAALNTPANQASASVFLRVLRDAMFSGAGSADLLLPRLPLGELLPEPASRWLAQHGAQVLTSTRVMCLEPNGSGWLVDGDRFDAVVLCCTAGEAARLVKDHDRPWAERAASLRYEPIVTVYAMSAGTRLPQAMTLLQSGETDGPAQFVFDQGWLSGRSGLLSFVISAAQPWVEAGSAVTSAATFAQAQTQLRDHLMAPLTTVQVLIEKRATFRCTPGLPRPATRIADGLTAAGDYVDGPYPATIEGAVKSGIDAVRIWRRASGP